MYIHMKKAKIQRAKRKSAGKSDFEGIAKRLAELTREIEKLVPMASVKEASHFGNSAHVVLPKSFAGKKVGVFVLPS